MCHLEIGVCCADQSKQAIPPQVRNGNHYHTGEKRNPKLRCQRFCECFPFPASQGNTQCGGGSIAKEQTQSPADYRDWENDTSSGVPKIPDTVTDKNLIYDVVEA